MWASKACMKVSHERNGFAVFVTMRDMPLTISQLLIGTAIPESGVSGSRAWAAFPAPSCPVTLAQRALPEAPAAPGALMLSWARQSQASVCPPRSPLHVCGRPAVKDALGQRAGLESLSQGGGGVRPSWPPEASGRCPGRAPGHRMPPCDSLGSTVGPALPSFPRTVNP